MDDGKIPILPYTRYKGKKAQYRPWEYTYDSAADTYTCPRGGVLRLTTTDHEGKRTYRSTPACCRDCPCKSKCEANEKGQKVFITHIWQEYLDVVEGLRKTTCGKAIYAKRKETIKRVFADAKEKHAIRYTSQRLGRSYKIGQAKICCHESENAGDLELEDLLFPPYFRYFAPFCWAVSRQYIESMTRCIQRLKQMPEKEAKAAAIETLNRTGVLDDFGKRKGKIISRE